MKAKFSFLKDVILYWHRNQAMRMSAALTYYALASLTPMFVLLLSLAGLFINPQKAGTILTGPVALAIGTENTRILQTVVDNAYDPERTITAGVLSMLIIILTGSELFRQLGFTLNAFWQTSSPPTNHPLVRKILVTVRNHLLYRIRAFFLVLSAGFLMIGTVLVSTGLELAETLLGNMLPIPYDLYTWINRLFGLAVSFLLFAWIYRFVPHRNMPWAAVWPGALVAALLFTLLQHFFSLYLSSTTLGKAFGPAGALVVLLFWVYYSMQTLFFGAAWTYQMNEGFTAQAAAPLDLAIDYTQ